MSTEDATHLGLSVLVAHTDDKRTEINGKDFLPGACEVLLRAAYEIQQLPEGQVKSVNVTWAWQADTQVFQCTVNVNRSTVTNTSQIGRKL
jgi:hypothetical protein